jgi:FOG: CheY-like receiver
VSFPLQVCGRVRGTFNFYTDEPHFFDPEEIKLLDELAMDIFFAIEFAEKEVESKQAEKETKQLALRGLREGDPLKEKLKDIEQAADRAANLTRQLLAFSRRQILEMKVIDQNFILEDMEKMLNLVIGEDIELKVKPGDQLGMVKGDPGQMEQVIVNLAVNAKDAMPKEKGKGTTFKIYFPRVFEPGEELAKKETGEDIPRGTETILVVENDGTVRKLAVDILRTQGYTVLEAEAGGGEALLVCEQYKEPIHLILTDGVMPHMSGAQFIERLRQVRKDFKVIYMTRVRGECDYSS